MSTKATTTTTKINDTTRAKQLLAMKARQVAIAAETSGCEAIAMHFVALSHRYEQEGR